MTAILKTALHQLKSHAPFTLVGTLTGIGLMVFLIRSEVPRSVSVSLFGMMHPFHLFLSAIVTTGMYRIYGRGKILPMLLIGYLGSIGIGSLSDCIIPWIGEKLMNLPNRGLHLGFIEKCGSNCHIPVPGGLDSLLYQRYSVPSFISGREE